MLEALRAPIRMGYTYIYFTIIKKEKISKNATNTLYCSEAYRIDYQ